MNSRPIAAKAKNFQILLLLAFIAGNGGTKSIHPFSISAKYAELFAPDMAFSCSRHFLPRDNGDSPRKLQEFVLHVCQLRNDGLTYSAPSLEADRAPRGFRSINSTSALSLGIWVSVPESGRREGLGNQGGGTNSIYPMELWQLEVWAHAFRISISSSGIFQVSPKQCIFGLSSSSCISHYIGNLRSYLSPPQKKQAVSQLGV
jgi:hypothetical protein